MVLNFFFTLLLLFSITFIKPSFAQEQLKFSDLNNLKETELTEAIKRHSRVIDTYDMNDGRMLELSISEILSRPNTIGETDLKILRNFKESRADSQIKSNNTIDKACSLLSIEESDIHAVASLVMRADREAEDGLSDHYREAYEKLSEKTKSNIEKSIINMQSTIQTTTLDLVGLSQERPSDVRRLLKKGCERRRNKSSSRIPLENLEGFSPNKED
ncbi:hypothetical protein [Microbulbifer variabilis]|uniref:hypothetical protein n=1 Tax=Microbulbifer variabilis TaxID=266805 RepID=UPI001CFCC483|nr:hypothetical protein [Microbulbifer variabilis]